MRRQTWREAMFTPTGAFKPWTSTLVVILAVGLMSIFTIVYVAQQQRKICHLVVLIDDRNQELPPADQGTMDFRRELHAYRQKIGC